MQYDKLTNDERVAHNTQVSLLAVLGQVTKKKNRDRIEAAVKTSSSEIPVGKTLTLFS